MTFSLEKLFVDVFAPQNGDIVTIMYDLPHGRIPDTQEWQDRRQMAQEWHQEINHFAHRYNIQVNPIVTYEATGAHNSDLPEHGRSQSNPIPLDHIAQNSTIIISMPQFSATAPLITLTRKYENLRVASLPLVTRAMQETGLAADYNKIAKNLRPTRPHLRPGRWRRSPLFYRPHLLFRYRRPHCHAGQRPPAPWQPAPHNR